MFMRKKISLCLLSVCLLSSFSLGAEENVILSNKKNMKSLDDISNELAKVNEKISNLKIQKEALEASARETEKQTKLLNEQKKEALLLAKKEVKKLEAQKEILAIKKYAGVLGKGENYITAHIDLSDQEMYVYRGENILYKWNVSTARRGYVTPKGNYKPQFIERMHYSKRYHNSPMPYSIFFHGNYAIHGTNSIRRLGRRASHGCVRLHPKHAKKLYALVKEYGKPNIFIKITP